MLSQGDQGSRVRGPIASLSSLVGASPAKSRQLLPQLSVPSVTGLSLSPVLEVVCCRESTRTRWGGRPSLLGRWNTKWGHLVSLEPGAGRTATHARPESPGLRWRAATAVVVAAPVEPVPEGPQRLERFQNMFPCCSGPGGRPKGVAAGSPAGSTESELLPPAGTGGARRGR